MYNYIFYILYIAGGKKQRRLIFSNLNAFEDLRLHKRIFRIAYTVYHYAAEKMCAMSTTEKSRITGTKARPTVEHANIEHLYANNPRYLDCTGILLHYYPADELSHLSS